MFFRPLLSLSILAQAAVCFAAEKPVTLSSLAELAQAAAQSGQNVKLKPGMYRMIDFIPLSSIKDRQKRQEWQFLNFSGNDNTFDLTGVTIEFDTALRGALHAPIHTDEFLIKGSGNTLKGVTITNIGNGIVMGGAVVGVTGSRNTLRDFTVRVQGSAPYGYGDLFGKGGHKHSGMHITGSGTHLVGCKVFTHAFGHAFYLQEDCADCSFEDCHAEGVMRRTDEILDETSGIAFERKFRTEMKNRSGEERILRGYMKALSEDGFRTYGTHKNLSFKNCTAKNMRGGFELRTKTATHVENCTATGCERAFWVSTGAVVTKCQGDTQYGPLLYVEGDNASVEVKLLPTEADKITVHAIAAIYGTGNKVTLTAKGKRVHALPILIGYGPPGMGENMAPHPVKDTRRLMLMNETAMPLIIGAKAGQCEITTNGPAQENLGKDIVIHDFTPAGSR